MVELQYFPTITSFKTLFQSTNVVFSPYEQYRKSGSATRCLIAGSNGVIKLTVPIVGGRNQKSLLKDIAIVKDQDWQIRHFKTIKSCYNRSPWFDEYHDSLAALYQKRFNFLIDWNLECLEWASSRIGWQGNILGIRLPYYDEKVTMDPGIGLVPYEEIIRYHQVFEDRTGFIPNLSILDLLFCEGGRALSLLSA